MYLCGCVVSYVDDNTANTAYDVDVCMIVSVGVAVIVFVVDVFGISVVACVAIVWCSCDSAHQCSLGCVCCCCQCCCLCDNVVVVTVASVVAYVVLIVIVGVVVVCVYL